MLTGRTKPRCRGQRIDGILLETVDDIICAEHGGLDSLWTLNRLVYDDAAIVVWRVKRPIHSCGARLERRQNRVWHLRRVVKWLEYEIRQALAGQCNRLRNAPKNRHIPADPLPHARIGTLLSNPIIRTSKSRNKVSAS